MPDALKPGDLAPDFELMNQDKQKVKLSDFRGKKKVALLFYPMDFSPTCTEEFCTFGPQQDKISPDGETVIFGVSCDSPFSHAAFRRTYNITLDLLSDPTRKMVKAYGLFAGEEPYNCSKRGTVIVDKDGRIVFHSEVPMREPRKVEDLARQVSLEGLAEIEREARNNEFGGST
jgi:peroxiredoxin